MAKYLVKGLRFVDMCGHSEEIVLGVVELDKNTEFFKAMRPLQTGHFYFDGNAYHTYLFDRLKEIGTADLNDFRQPGWKLNQQSKGTNND